MKIKKAVFSGSSVKVGGKPSPALPEFAFIGRSNVGKSSLINMLTGNGSLAKTSQTPGKTQLVNHFMINDKWYLVDLPGYGYARLPDKDRARLRHIIWHYINNSQELVMLFVLVDSRHDMQEVDLRFISKRVCDRVRVPPGEVRVLVVRRVDPCRRRRFRGASEGV